ncbi:MAG TPA: NAD(P)-binding protein, partial [Anaerolineae bacterium]|nr:NAD(P)-binding protein [Anaerolineae bacterium]
LFNQIWDEGQENLVLFSMEESRKHAWRIAERLAPLPPSTKKNTLKQLDQEIAGISQLIWRSSYLLKPLFRLTWLQEKNNVHQNIDILLGGQSLDRSRLWAVGDGIKKRQKIAILGGGIAALTSAFELTHPQNPRRDEYDITVYQLGWRLGGKGASGRNMKPGYGHRIEEHGFHFWPGFYENGFRLIRECYQELNRPPDAPLASWRDAFVPVTALGSIDEHDQQLLAGPIIPYPPNNRLPGDGSLFLSIPNYIAMSVTVMINLIRQSSLVQIMTIPIEQLVLDSPLIEFIANTQKNINQKTSSALALTLDILQVWADQFRLESKTPNKLQQKIWQKSQQLLMNSVASLLTQMIGWLWLYLEEKVTTNPTKREFWIELNFLYSNVIGAIKEQIYIHGFDSINEFEYQEWLTKYAWPDGNIMLDSSIMASMYIPNFAYLDGDPNKPQLEAGTALRTLARITLTTKGEVAWKMQAGAGDAVFAPLYEVLKKRGVNFKFFHRVKEIKPSQDDKQTIDRIIIDQQVNIKDEKEYQPLVDINGLPCWPSQPLYDQITAGTMLKDTGINLETAYNSWSNGTDIQLNLGTDFDKIILGIPVGALPAICPDLIASSNKWHNMVTHLKTVRTQALQLWLDTPPTSLGWSLWEKPVLAFKAPTLGTWADVDHLLTQESWPAEYQPASIAYFCSVMADDEEYETGDDTQEAHKQANAKVKASALALLNEELGRLWPQSQTQNPNQFLWESLYDPQQRNGQERFTFQHWQANISPSERYVLSVPGSSKYRLPANDPEQFPNLYLTGDWTDNGLNSGCMEAAIMSGMLASLAVSGYPQRQHIWGIDF